MAQTKSKSTGAKSAGKPKSGRSPAPKGKSGKAAPARLTLRAKRTIWAGAYLFFGFIALLSLLGLNGFLIDWYDTAVSALFGYGFYLMPFCLIGAGVILLVRLRGKARLHVACVMLLPFLWGAALHLLNDAAVYLPNGEGVKALCDSGIARASGGLLSGYFAVMARSAISNGGAVVLLMILCAASAFFGFSVLAAPIWRSLARLRVEPEPQNPPEPERVRPAPAARRRAVIDIDIDDDPQKPAPEKPAGQIPPPNVATPAEALLGAEEAVKDEYPVAEDPRRETRPTFESTEADISHAPPEPPADEREQLMEQLDEAATAELDSYVYPPVSLLSPGQAAKLDYAQENAKYSERLVDTLRSFGIESTIVDITRGPTVTRYELQLQRGTKFSRVTSLSEDIALSLGAAGVRISTIPDKLAVGIEVPNESVELVVIRDIIESAEFRGSKSKLSFAVGKNISDERVVGDAALMPHMLIAGTTGSGKSVCINSILISLIYKSTPEEVRMIMIDPKMIELGVYNGIPHLLIPVVTDPRKAAGALNWAVGEMMKRYKLFSEVGVRDLASYNREMRTREEGETLPQIVIVIDELADLMFVAAGEVEEAIARIAQMARAAGMHLIIATQRPSADVITGIMKANIPSRIAFAVASQIESRIILDTMGAEKLIGRGDMLYYPLGSSKPQRVQGCYITSKEIEDVVSFIKKTGKPDYSEEVIEHIEKQAEGGGSSSGANGADDEDELLPQAVEIFLESGQASVSMLQRRLKLGYSRAARLVDQMEQRGIVGPFEGSKPRAILITRAEWQERTLRQ